MSFDGFRQYWCEVGHMWAHNALEEKPDTCPQCGRSIAFVHVVDQTNGYMNDQIVTEIVAEARICECSCGHMHVVGHTRYRIPTATDVRNAARRRRRAEQKERDANRMSR